VQGSEGISDYYNFHDCGNFAKSFELYLKQDYQKNKAAFQQRKNPKIEQLKAERF